MFGAKVNLESRKRTIIFLNTLDKKAAFEQEYREPFDVLHESEVDTIEFSRKLNSDRNIIIVHESNKDHFIEKVIRMVNSSNSVCFR